MHRPAPLSSFPPRAVRLLCLLLLGLVSGGCATIRVTDPARTATEQFLIRTATAEAIDKLSFDLLRDRRVYVETTYLTAQRETEPDTSFLIGELRAKLLRSGCRLADKREGENLIVLEIRSGGNSVDRVEFLLGLPSLFLSSGSLGGSGNTPVSTPELSILKSTKQYGFTSVAFVAYWNNTGELVYQSGPFVGRTFREDWWIFGTGPRTSGDIAPVEKPQ
ncbi:MAG TPA: DUF6655 family protein [Tepidisphaeraceae bacterium]|nr:DUF6655 family protein [Tepidisphaeraceae bacterium]